MLKNYPAYFRYMGPDASHPFVPLPWQEEARAVVRIPWPGPQPDGTPYPMVYGINCGRRTGKTTLEETFIWDGLLSPNDRFGPPNVRVTADTEEHGRKVWDKFIYHAHSTPLAGLKADYSRERELFTSVTGATVQLISANNPNALSGDSVSLWLVDEAQFLSQAAMENLFPSVAERNGVIVMLGTAEGSGPFREVCFKGDNPAYPEYKRLRYPSTANPLVPRRMIEFARRTMTPTRFAQLYEAEWVGDAGSIFRNVEGCISDDEVVSEAALGYFYCQEPRYNHDYFMGVDLGRLQDWTVVTVWNRRGLLVAWDRFSIIDWQAQKARIQTLSAAYHHPLCHVDMTGIGDPIVEDLERLGMRIEGVQISTNTKKRSLIDELAVRIGSNQISYPRIPVLIEELNRMEARKSKAENSNIVVYSAPSGGTDDFVMSAALGVLGVPRFDRVVLPVRPEDAPERQVGAWESL